jgi:hypothetical protein
MNTINTNAACNATSIIAIICLIFIYTVNILIMFCLVTH